MYDKPFVSYNNTVIALRVMFAWLCTNSYDLGGYTPLIDI